jgi:hypothetical protein
MQGDIATDLRCQIKSRSSQQSIVAGRAPPFRRHGGLPYPYQLKKVLPPAGGSDRLIAVQGRDHRISDLRGKQTACRCLVHRLLRAPANWRVSGRWRVLTCVCSSCDAVFTCRTDCRQGFQYAVRRVVCCNQPAGLDHEPCIVPSCD